MSSYTLADEELERIPDLEIAQKKFLLTLPEYREDVKAKHQLLEIIRTRNMAPWYESIYQDLHWDCDEELLAEMKAHNEEVLQDFDETIAAAEKDSGVIEVKEAFVKKAEYLISIGDKENAIKTFGQAFSLTMALGYKLDNVFTCIRIGFFFLDHDLIRRNLDRAEDLIQMGADYDRKNRLTVYQGLYSLIIRDFEGATDKFLGLVSTFTCSELFDYSTFIRYTVFAAIFTLPRKQLYEKVINSSDILAGLYRIPNVKMYAFSLYNCDYADFFRNLAEVEKMFQKDYFLHPHCQFYVREMRIKAYSQMLFSYRSLTLSYMAEQFGVTPEFIEDELRRFIVAKRIYGKIDKAKGIIVVERGTQERTNELFKNTIRQGDLLLNRIHKLSRTADSYN